MMTHKNIDAITQKFEKDFGLASIMLSSAFCFMILMAARDGNNNKLSEPIYKTDYVRDYIKYENENLYKFIFSDSWLSKYRGLVYLPGRHHDLRQQISITLKNLGVRKEYPYWSNRKVMPSLERDWMCLMHGQELKDGTRTRNCNYLEDKHWKNFFYYVGVFFMTSICFFSLLKYCAKFEQNYDFIKSRFNFTHILQKVVPGLSLGSIISNFLGTSIFIEREVNKNVERNNSSETLEIKLSVDSVKLGNAKRRV